MDLFGCLIVFVFPADIILLWDSAGDEKQHIPVQRLCVVRAVADLVEKNISQVCYVTAGPKYCDTKENRSGKYARLTMSELSGPQSGSRRPTRMAMWLRKTCRGTREQ